MPRPVLSGRLPADVAHGAAPGDRHHPRRPGEVDGRAADLLRANYAFSAVPVPAGEHEVRVYFAPASVRIGAFISLASITGFAIVLAVTVCRKPAPR